VPNASAVNLRCYPSAATIGFCDSGLRQFICQWP